MPELPEVETVVRQLAPYLRGRIVRRMDILDPNNTFDIGKRNILAVKRILWENRLGVLVEDIGEDISRNIRVDVETGEVVVKNLGKERLIL